MKGATRKFKDLLNSRSLVCFVSVCSCCFLRQFFGDFIANYKLCSAAGVQAGVHHFEGLILKRENDPF